MPTLRTAEFQNHVKHIDEIIPRGQLFCHYTYSIHQVYPFDYDHLWSLGVRRASVRF